MILEPCLLAFLRADSLGDTSRSLEVLSALLDDGADALPELGLAPGLTGQPGHLGVVLVLVVPDDVVLLALAHVLGRVGVAGVDYVGGIV